MDDYAFLIRGLIDLYQACFDEKWLDMATDLQKKQNDLFWDSENSGFYSISQNDEFMIMRLKEGEIFLFILYSILYCTDVYYR